MRKLSINILRYDPAKKDDVPHWQEYEVEETPSLTILETLLLIQTKLDRSLYFDGVCRSNVCGSCAVLINGRPVLACRTQTAAFGNKINLAPLTYFPIIKDLATDKFSYFKKVSEKIKNWIHTDQKFNPELETLMTDQEQNPIYEADRCIECGICIESCMETKLDPNYLGAAGLNKVYRFVVDPRDNRKLQDMMMFLANDEGVFGCEGMLGCRDFCPKEIDLAKHIALLRNRVVVQTFKNSLGKVFKAKDKK